MGTAPFHQLPGATRAPAHAFWTRADDGVRLRLALWRDGACDAGTVLLFNGRTEYVEKYAPIAGLLNDHGFAVISLDWRGQGLSDRLQGNPRPGHITDFADYQRDVVELVSAATEIDLPRPWHLLGHSMGGCIGLAALMNGLPVETASFSAPMWGINTRQMPGGIAIGMARLATRAGQGARAAIGTGGDGTYVLDEGFSANLLTPDIDEWSRLTREAAHWPDLTIGGATYDWVHAGLGECRRLAALPSPDLPMMVSLGSDEEVVSAPAIRDRAARWPGARLVEVAGARHEVLMDAPERRDAFIAAMLGLTGRGTP